MRIRTIDLLLTAVAIATSACGELIGVEEVTSEGGGGAGGAEEAAAPAGVGAGLPFTVSSAGGSTGSTSSAASSTDAAGTGAGGDAASTGSGAGGCGVTLPACPGTVPSTFESDADIDLGFERDGDPDEIGLSSGRLELEPRKNDDDDDDDEELRYAAVRSRDPIVPGGAPCAVWVELVESGSELAAGLAVGPGSPWDDDYRIEQRGVVVAASVGGADVAQVPYVKEVTRYLRIRFEAGMVGFDVSSDATCWSAVGQPVPMTAPDGLVRLHAEGESGKAKLDGYCL